jgi:hypothetical protein
MQELLAEFVRVEVIGRLPALERELLEEQRGESESSGRGPSELCEASDARVEVEWGEVW